LVNDNDDNAEKSSWRLASLAALGPGLDCLGKPVKAWSEHSMSHHTSSSHEDEDEEN